MRKDGSRDKPESQGRIAVWRTKIKRNGYVKIPIRFRNFTVIFLMMAAGEFGDKTQIVTIGLASQYGETSAIWFGEMLAIVPMSAANALFFYRVSDRLNQKYFRIGSAAIFLVFSVNIFAKYLFGFSFLAI
ncbi:MAG: TMEM165/GDT1 family protein [Halobacteria archaeon]